ncbi:unnamed protein product [Nippostrongylus brasiliensis]|uniref:Uncharacterized protein n=1 Tax=Nippostrongylus brasiliensis TaxID=27835 RepID=A0A0N4XXL2_NIPBR|nr:unnamed protein product [Nippostrongylus brasiliensis]
MHKPAKLTALVQRRDPADLVLFSCLDAPSKQFCSFNAGAPPSSANRFVWPCKIRPRVLLISAVAAVRDRYVLFNHSPILLLIQNPSVLKTSSKPAKQSSL